MSSDSTVENFSECRLTKVTEWKIKYFFSYPQEYSVYSSPQVFFSDLVYHLEIIPTGQKEKSASRHVSLFLKIDENPSGKTFDFEFGLKDIFGNIQNKRILTWTSDNSNSGWHKFIKRCELPNVYMQNGTLIIVCTVILKDKVSENGARKRKLSEDFRDMFASKRYCDLTLKVKEETFETHKLILTARSPVFAAMFQSEMSEKENGIVNISDCEPEAFRNFLCYLYSGEVDFKDCRPLDVYKIADKYDVPELMPLCADNMISNLSAENVAEIYACAHQFQDINLMKEAQIFSIQNFKKVIYSDGWISLMESDYSTASDFLKGMLTSREMDLDR